MWLSIMHLPFTSSHLYLFVWIIESIKKSICFIFHIRQEQPELYGRLCAMIVTVCDMYALVFSGSEFPLALRCLHLPMANRYHFLEEAWEKSSCTGSSGILETPFASYCCSQCANLSAITHPSKTDFFAQCSIEISCYTLLLIVIA